MRLKHCLLGLIALQAFLPSAAQDAATDSIYRKVEAFGRVLPQE